MDEREKKGLAGIAGNEIQFDCSARQYTTFRAGGRVDAIYFATGLNKLQRMILALKKANIQYLAVGKGSNLLVKDSGFKGVLIILRGELAIIERDREVEGMISAGGGISIMKLLDYCKNEGLSGLEFLSGIPGTVGGAVAMNAGAFGKDTGSLVREVHMINPEGKLVSANHSQIKFSYRYSSIMEDGIIFKAGFTLDYEGREIVAGKMAEYLTKRRETQPLEYPSGGSVFKNPAGNYAGRLIEQAGLKGRRIGGAMISPKHANFIVNRGGASAEDILQLMALARQKVKQETGIWLEPEIRVIG